MSTEKSTKPTQKRSSTGKNLNVGAQSANPLRIRIVVTKRVAAYLLKLPPKQYSQLDTRITQLGVNPHPHDRRPMTDMPDVFRIDAGEYRIGFKEEKTSSEHIVTVILVDRRNDKAFYKKLKSLI